MGGRIRQVSHYLPADRRVRIEQPLYNRSIWLRGLPFGWISRHLLVLLLAIVVLLAVAAAVPWRWLAAVPAQAPVGPRDPARMAAPAPASAPVPGGPKFLMVNAFQFRPAFPNRNWDFYNGELNNPGPEDNFFEAALSLPDHIKVTKMVV
jgi:hypothetical protein